MFQHGVGSRDDLSAAIYLYRPGDGGLDRVAIMLANHMARQGKAVELWMAHTDGVSAHLVDSRVPVRRVAAPGGNRRLSMIAQFPALAAMVRRHRPDILYSAGNQSNMLVALACLGTTTRSVARISNPICPPGRRDLAAWARWKRFCAISRISDLTIVMGEHDRALLGRSGTVRLLPRPTVTPVMDKVRMQRQPRDAESKEGPGLSLTPKMVYEALAANPYGKGANKAQTWKDVDATLPAIPISVFGPPSTSGTRDSLAELILEKGCQTDPAMAALKEKNEDEYKATCTRIREDGKYVDSGENDNLIVQKLGANPNAVGVFGFSFLEENKNTLKDVPINGIQATYETVSTGQYPGARPLYIYVKKAHMQAVPGLQAYLNIFASNWGPGGVLAKRGMVPAPEDVRKANAETVKSLTVLDGADLK